MTELIVKINTEGHIIACSLKGDLFFSDFLPDVCVNMCKIITLIRNSSKYQAFMRYNALPTPQLAFATSVVNSRCGQLSKRNTAIFYCCALQYTWNFKRSNVMISLGWIPVERAGPKVRFWFIRSISFPALVNISSLHGWLHDKFVKDWRRKIVVNASELIVSPQTSGWMFALFLLLDLWKIGLYFHAARLYYLFHRHLWNCLLRLLVLRKSNQDFIIAISSYLKCRFTMLHRAHICGTCKLTTCHCSERCWNSFQLFKLN